MKFNLFSTLRSKYIFTVPGQNLIRRLFLIIVLKLFISSPLPPPPFHNYFNPSSTKINSTITLYLTNIHNYLQHILLLSNLGTLLKLKKQPMPKISRFFPPLLIWNIAVFDVFNINIFMNQLHHAPANFCDDIENIYFKLSLIKGTVRPD